MSSRESYAQQWRDLQRRKFLALAAFVLYLPGAVVLFLALSVVAHDWTRRYEALIGLCWFALFVSALIYQGVFRCPNCSKSFFVSDRWRNSFSTRCLNCGIRQGEDAPSPEPRDLRT